MYQQEGYTFQGSLCSPLKSGGFCGTFVCTSKGYVERETSLALLEREAVTFQGSLCLPLKSAGFCGKSRCTSKGYGKRETSLYCSYIKLLSLQSRERKSLFRAFFAQLSKVLVFCGKSRCTSKGYVERETSLATLKRKGGICQGSLCSSLKSAGFMWQICVHQ